MWNLNCETKKLEYDLEEPRLHITCVYHVLPLTWQKYDQKYITNQNILWREDHFGYLSETQNQSYHSCLTVFSYNLAHTVHLLGGLPFGASLSMIHQHRAKITAAYFFSQISPPPSTVHQNYTPLPRPLSMERLTFAPGRQQSQKELWHLSWRKS